jgi:hypothetical protein
MTEPTPAPAGDRPPDHDDDPIVDLLGVLAYGELTGFVRLAADAELAPALEAKAALGRLAVVEFGHFERLSARLREMGADPGAAMAPYRAAIDEFHERTAPSTWLEGLVKAFVGDGIATDFYREISRYVDPGTRALVTEVLADAGHSQFIVRSVRAAIEDDPRIAGRLALWGRRLVGEALSQAQRVAAERDGLASLLVGTVDSPGADIAELVHLFGRLTTSHTKRMGQLGLSS